MLSDSTCDPPETIVARGLQWWQSFVQSNASLPPTFARPPEIEKWSPPLVGSLKINLDGAWNPQLKMGGFECIYRDASGNFLMAKSGSYSDIFSPLQAKASAFHEAVLGKLLKTLRPFFHQSLKLHLPVFVAKPTVLLIVLPILVFLLLKVVNGLIPLQV
ncbi:hypothetical protein ACFX1Z_022961 [Malus domestica]